MTDDGCTHNGLRFAVSTLSDADGYGSPAATRRRLDSPQFNDPDVEHLSRLNEQPASMLRRSGNPWAMTIHSTRPSPAEASRRSKDRTWVFSA